MKTKLFIALGALAAMAWAAPLHGAAHFHGAIAQQRRSGNALARPLPARFRVERDRGLLLRVWINQTGPYVFALDTGAGMNVISQRVVTNAGLPTKAVTNTFLGGLSSASIASNREAILTKLSVGERTNSLALAQTALIVSSLPPDIDGILDPTEAYAPYGYAIDMPKQQIEAIDTTGLELRIKPGVEGGRVAWVSRGDDTRPFVRLGDGRIALVDTGSAFGLAVNERDAVIVGRNGARTANSTSTDLAGGVISSRRVMPTTISIGELTLRKIPTDVVFGSHEGAPVILGRDALYPFRMTFDPKRRLIEFVTSDAG